MAGVDGWCGHSYCVTVDGAPNIMEGIRCEEPDSLGSINLDALPNAAAENGADQDIRVENNHLNARSSFPAGASV